MIGLCDHLKGGRTGRDKGEARERQGRDSGIKIKNRVRILKIPVNFEFSELPGKMQKDAEKPIKFA